MRACCLAAVLAAAGIAACADVGTQAGDAMASMHFDLPAQPLDRALADFGRLTGHSVLVDSAMTRGLAARAVVGDLDPKEALRRLLDGTGLSARYSGANAFTLVPESAPVEARAGTSPDVEGPGLPGRAGAPASATGEFAGALQAGITRAMCAIQPTTFGRYRAALQLWIGPEGRVRRARLLESSGLKARDTELLAQMRGLAIGHPPPVELPQPLTVLLSPRPESAGPCHASSPAGD